MNRMLLAFGVFVLAVGGIALLAWLTLYEEDPCASSQGDIGAAVLAEGNGDQDALVNRAIIVKGTCEQKEAE